MTKLLTKNRKITFCPELYEMKNDFLHFDTKKVNSTQYKNCSCIIYLFESFHLNLI